MTAPVPIQPVDTVPIPFDFEKGSEPTPTIADRVAVAANTAAMLAELGMPLEVGKREAEIAERLLKGAKTGDVTRKITDRGVALKLAALLQEYDKEIVKDAAQLRSYVTHRLIEVSDCGETKHELKALELLGKMSDVGLFTERTEVTITHKTSDDLASAIKDRIKRLLNPDILDVTPVVEDVNETLGDPHDIFAGPNSLLTPVEEQPLNQEEQPLNQEEQPFSQEQPSAL